MVFGVRAEKDKINVSILDGNKKSPSFKDENRLKVVINIHKTAQSRAEELYYLRREFDELIKKYSPKLVALKDAESSQHTKVQPNILRGEVEGMIQLACFENRIEVERFLYTQLKSRLPLEGKQRSKDFLYEELSKQFISIKLDDKHKDSLLCAWAVLDE